MQRLFQLGRVELANCRSRVHRKEVGDVVTERAIVRVLLDRHDLDAVVAELTNPRQHLVLEVGVAVDTRLLAAHAHMALIDAQRTWPAQAGTGTQRQCEATSCS